ncbi:UDP-glycosyltransferase 73C25-like [Humulus lupulus]|uniref:UDP-glycosyltransferase 73C25-like n=1 Tax=Humulus lupulus TaxID=3486 RepID=UPI002B40ED49|nr:UDP-glycosyltransferase 73C25-like [Humulus lupulus]
MEANVKLCAHEGKALQDRAIWRSKLIYATPKESSFGSSAANAELGSGVVSWCSKRKPTVSLSTIEEEYRAAALSTQESTWLMQLMKDLHQSTDNAVARYCDNQVLDNVSSETERFVVPGMPEWVEITKAHLPGKIFLHQWMETEMGSYGIIINTFQEMEPTFVKDYKKCEKLVAQVLNTAKTLGVEDPMNWGEEEKGWVKMKRETIKCVLEEVLDVGDKCKERRERARKLGEMDKRTVEEGGSSYINMILFLEEIMQLGSSDQH